MSAPTKFRFPDPLTLLTGCVLIFGITAGSAAVMADGPSALPWGQATLVYWASALLFFLVFGYRSWQFRREIVENVKPGADLVKAMKPRKKPKDGELTPCAPSATSGTWTPTTRS